MSPFKNYSAGQRVDREMLKKLVPPGGLNFDDFNRLADGATVDEKPAGTVLARAGDSGGDVLFLLDGQLELVADDGTIELLAAGTSDARRAVAEGEPREVTVRACSAVKLARFDRDKLNQLMQPAVGLDMEVVEDSDEDTGPSGGGRDWMSWLLGHPCIKQLPPAHIHGIFSQLHEVPARAGKTIVRQGHPVDGYYVLATGSARVSRSLSSGGTMKLAVLTEGQSFGDEALLSESPSAVSVTMESDGVLMRLGKDDFDLLMRDALVSTVDRAQAERMAADGAVLIDVREPGMARTPALPGSIEIPLFMLLLKAETLDKQLPCICCCETGPVSMAAAFKLRELGFEAYVLEGGLATAEVMQALESEDLETIELGERDAPAGLHQPAPPDTTVADHLTQWLASQRETLGERTYREYQRICENHLIPALGTTALAELTPDDVQDYLKRARTRGRVDGSGGLSRSTIERHERLLARAISFDAPQAPGTQQPDAADSRLELLDMVEDTPLHVPVMLALCTGMRPAELIALRWEDIDDDRVRVAEHESSPAPLLLGGSRVDAAGSLVVLPAEVLGVLEMHQQQQNLIRRDAGARFNPQGLVICDDDGAPWSVESLSRELEELARSRGREPASLDDLYRVRPRSTGATVQRPPKRPPQPSARPSADAGAAVEDEVADLLESGLMRGGRRF